jgi:uncharacterized membrane protein YphA (DoxX/SURF4 family)
MTDVQTAIVISTGCVFALLAIFLAKAELQLRVSFCLRLLLVLKILLSFATILVLPFTKPNVMGKLPLRGFRIVSTYIGLFFLGIFLIYLITSWLRRPGAKHPIVLPHSEVQKFYGLFCWAMAGIFIWSGIVKWVYPALDKRFFLTSGYGQEFFVFITAVEILCGIGLLWRRAALYAAVILILDMAGAICTHYHNYFSRHLPDPFSNSLTALALQPYLITILVLSVAEKRKAKSAKKKIT